METLIDVYSLVVFKTDNPSNIDRLKLQLTLGLWTHGTHEAVDNLESPIGWTCIQFAVPRDVVCV